MSSHPPRPPVVGARALPKPCTRANAQPVRAAGSPSRVDMRCPWLAARAPRLPLFPTSLFVSAAVAGDTLSGLHTCCLARHWSRSTTMLRTAAATIATAAIKATASTATAPNTDMQTPTRIHPWPCCLPPHHLSCTTLHCRPVRQCITVQDSTEREAFTRSRGQSRWRSQVR